MPPFTFRSRAQAADNGDEPLSNLSDGGGGSNAYHKEAPVHTANPQSKNRRLLIQTDYCRHYSFVESCASNRGGPFHSLIETLKPLRMRSAKRQMFSRLYVNRIPTIIKEWKSGNSLAFMVSSSRTDADSNFFKRLCHGMWLFHLHSAVKIQPFSPVFPLVGSTAKAFCRLSLWSLKEKASTVFYNTAKHFVGYPLWNFKGKSVSPFL